MIEDVIKITRRKTDLASTTEYWQECSYAEKERQIFEFIKEKIGCKPSDHMKYIQEVSFAIMPQTLLCDLQSLAKDIADVFPIQCFQISIDRSKNQAHMLFDWYDRKNECNFQMYNSLQYRLSAMILIKLNLPCDMLDIQWYRHLLLSDFRSNPKIFEELLEWVRHQKPGKKQYQLIETSLLYIKNVCLGLVK